MVLGICDDNELFRKQLVKVCEEFIESENLIVEIREYSCGEEVIEDSQDILLLDIEMPGMNGIDVKGYLEKAERDTFIIYVSGYDEYMIEAFGINVLGFISKYKVTTDLNYKLVKACEKACRCAKIGGIDSRKVVYVEKENNGDWCIIHLLNGETARQKKTLETVEKEVGRVHFCKIDRSTLVNFEYTKKVKDGMVTLFDATILHTSRSKKKMAEDAFWEYLRKQC